MTFSLLEIELHDHSQSWIALLSIQRHSLFLVEWDYWNRVTLLEVLGMRVV